ncbi:MAG: TetR/AcrR family transcriptional regulator [Pseudomonadota bacterium]|nr:TetR/AcrR family transcriptional regulator [Pseudomonadota bacterium]
MDAAENLNSPRERILQAATDLFYGQGIRAVGVDLIIATAKVAKASFYKYFPAKDDLVVAFLQEQDVAWRVWIDDSTERLSPDPAGRPLALFDALAERTAQGDFRGCPFINTVIELADPKHQGHKTAEQHRASNLGQLRDMLDDAGLDGDRLAPHFALLIDGALVTALQERGPAPAMRAKEMAAQLFSASYQP